MIFDDVQEGIVMKPKARRLIKNKVHKKYKMPKTSSNKNFINYYFWNAYDEGKSLNLDKISLDEINNDFMQLNQNLEGQYFYNEIMEILSVSNSKKDLYLNTNTKKSKNRNKENKPKITENENNYEHKNFESN